MDLHGQRVVIAGGTSGIGLATAQAAARYGAEVTVISRQQASIDRALADLPPAPAGGRPTSPIRPWPASCSMTWATSTTSCTPRASRSR